LSLRFVLVLTAALCCALSVFVAGCSDDPVLGPDEGEKEGGGSYSVIERLAPADSAAAPVRNPERF
jgi:hypothetical protein